MDADAPKKKRNNPFKQIAMVFKAVKAIDPTITQGDGVFLGVRVFLLIGLLLNHWIYFTIIGLPLVSPAAMIVLSRRGERAASGRWRARSERRRPSRRCARAGITTRSRWRRTSPPAGNANAAVVSVPLPPGVVLSARPAAARQEADREGSQKSTGRPRCARAKDTLYVGGRRGQIARARSPGPGPSSSPC